MVWTVFGLISNNNMGCMILCWEKYFYLVLMVHNMYTSFSCPCLIHTVYYIHIIWAEVKIITIMKKTFIKMYVKCINTAKVIQNECINSWKCEFDQLEATWTQVTDSPVWLLESDFWEWSKIIRDDDKCSVWPGTWALFNWRRRRSAVVRLCA